MPFNDDDADSSEKVGTHWWTAEVTKAVQEKKEAYKMMIQPGLSEEEQQERQKNYQEAKQRTKKVVRESKKKAEGELEKYWEKLKTLPQVLEESADGQDSGEEDVDQDAKVEGDGEAVTGQMSQKIHKLTEDEAKATSIFDVSKPLAHFTTNTCFSLHNFLIYIYMILSFLPVYLVLMLSVGFDITVRRKAGLSCRIVVYDEKS